MGKGCSCSPWVFHPPAVDATSPEQPWVMLEGTSLPREGTWCKIVPFPPCCFEAGVSTARMGREGRGAEEGEHPPRAELQADTFPWEAYGTNPVPDGNLLPLLQPPAQLLHSVRWPHPRGDGPKATPGRVSRVAQLDGTRGALLVLPAGHGSARTELAELTSPCLAGQGLKLGLGGQNLANEIMAIN